MVRPSNTVRDFGAEVDNGLDPAFEERMSAVRRRYFSRDPAIWPCFATPGFARVAGFRRRALGYHERSAAWPGGEELHARLLAETDIPAGTSMPRGEVDAMLEFAAGLSKDWEHPASVENVVTMPCDPGIYGAMMGSLANPNLVYREYSGLADEIEKSVARQIAKLAGWDPSRAAGIFTQGGTFCNLYGYLMGIRKSLPDTRAHGMGFVHDYRMVNSLGGHYSNITNLSLLGVDIATRTIRIKVTESNDIDLDDLERQLSACFELKCAVPTIMLTMGTTDTFGVDRVEPVCRIVDRLVGRYEVPVRPHIHVDSAIGWTMLFFLGYDFEAKNLSRLRRGLTALSAMYR
jgi:glutamate/tyrosine decarboxylase-like PLP-dependent enzyme